MSIEQVPGVDEGIAEGLTFTPGATLSERAEELEEHLTAKMNRRIGKSVLFTSGDLDPTKPAPPPADPSQHVLMGDDPRLPKMPKEPTLLDFFKYRFAPAQTHLLQSATHALKDGHNEKVVLACLLHDIGVVGFIRSDHGYWGAQLVEPYVDEEVSWAIRMHQALRFFPDESVGYEYPEMYVQLFGARLQARAVHRGGVQERPQPQVVHDEPPDHPERHLLVRPERQGRAWTTSSTSSAATSSSRKKGSGSTAARRRTCGAP